MDTDKVFVLAEIESLNKRLLRRLRTHFLVQNIKHSSGLSFTAPDAGKCRGSVWKDSRKEHVLPLLWERVDVV
jgi:hypothetical protein